MGSYFGSSNIDDDDIPRFGPDTVLLKSFRYSWPDGSLAFWNDKGRNPDDRKPYRPRRPNLMRYGDRIEPEDKPDTFFHLRGVPRPLPLYNLLALNDPANAAKTVFVVEGERDVDTLTSRGLLATTNYGGALKWRWRDGKKSGDYSDALIGRDVVVIPDNDDRGREHAEMVWRSLLNKASRIRLLLLPDLPEKGDVTDFYEAGNSLARFLSLVETAVEVRVQ